MGRAHKITYYTYYVAALLVLITIYLVLLREFCEAGQCWYVKLLRVLHNVHDP